MATKRTSVVPAETMTEKVVVPASKTAPTKRTTVQKAIGEAVPQEVRTESGRMSTTGRSTLPKGINVAQAVEEVREINAGAKPKRARPPKSKREAVIEAQAFPDAVDGSKATPEEVSLLQKQVDLLNDNLQALVIPKDAKVEIIPGEMSAEEVYDVADGADLVHPNMAALVELGQKAIEEDTVQEPEFKTNAPYTIIVRKQGGREELTARSYHEALDIAKGEHIATGRRTSILRPGMKAVHFHDEMAFNEMRAAEMRHAMAAGQARADDRRMKAHSEAQPQHMGMARSFQRNYGPRDYRYDYSSQDDRYDYSSQDIGMGRTLHL